jgi:mono/diheme cytochrome c family protein
VKRREVFGQIALLALSLNQKLAPQAGSVKQDRSRAIYAALAKVPENARERQNPFAHQTDAIAGGRKLFEQHCAECHGSAATGGRRGPSLVATQVQEATPGALFWILTNGVVKQGMPVWSKLPEAQRWQIVTFLKSLPASQ